MKKPEGLQGLHHVALFVRDLPACLQFYCEWIGFVIEWQPDADNVYLTSGADNLALHRVAVSSRTEPKTEPKPELEKGLGGHETRLDHIGLLMATPEAVDQWYEYLLLKKVVIRSAPRTHRDGARSFYCLDPEGVVVQFLYHPPLAVR